MLEGHSLEGRKVLGHTPTGSKVLIRVASVETEDQWGFFVYGYRTKLRNPGTALVSGKPRKYRVYKGAMEG